MARRLAPIAAARRGELAAAMLRAVLLVGGSVGALLLAGLIHVGGG